MEILIGRDNDSNCMALMIDGKRAKDTSCVMPLSVSRLKPDEHTAHCRITIKDDNGAMKICNLNPKNVTYVDGEEITAPVTIAEHSLVTLGDEQYRLNIKKFLKSIGYEKPVSIKHLKRVWEKYDRNLLHLQMEQQKAANQQKLQGLLSQASVLCVIIPSVIPSVPIPPLVRVLLVLCAIGLGVYFYIKGNKTDDSFVVKKRALDEQFRDDYVCPKCGYFFGITPYDSMEYKSKCPHCNSKLVT